MTEKTPKPPKTKVMITLPETQLARVDKLRKGLTTRSAFISRLIDLALSDQDRAA